VFDIGKSQPVNTKVRRSSGQKGYVEHPDASNTMTLLSGKSIVVQLVNETETEVAFVLGSKNRSRTKATSINHLKEESHEE